MGAPELPNDPGEDDLHITQIIHPPASPSDDSDNESMDVGVYEGYQPLAVDDHYADYDHNQRPEQRGLDEIVPTEVLHDDPKMPEILKADDEIEREVWNEPRPRELHFELDGNKTQQILSAMANFELPNLAVPDWATTIPEERWKEELLQRIRQRNSPVAYLKVELDRE